MIEPPPPTPTATAWGGARPSVLPTRSDAQCRKHSQTHTACAQDRQLGCSPGSQGLILVVSNCGWVNTKPGSPGSNPLCCSLKLASISSGMANTKPGATPLFWPSTFLHPQTDLSILAISIPSIKATTHITIVSVFMFYNIT